MNDKIENVISKMKLEDKIRLCSGASFWTTKAMPEYGIPSITLSDGPHGLRKQEQSDDMLGLNKSLPATCFPSAVTLGSSWDVKLAGEVGKAIAEEAKANEVSLVLGPGACIKRNPLCGRNFEYFSEDPYLTGKLAASYIKEAQKDGIGTSLKHFATNNQEFKRFSSDSVVDERALREIYLTGFEIAVKEGRPATVMCAYNKLNGIHCSNNKELLTTILRDEWGFDGLVVTDWGAIYDRLEGFKAGADLSMPGGSGYMEQEVYDAIKAGTLSEAYIDKAARRVLKLVFNATYALEHKSSVDYLESHHLLAKKVAESGAVLLKNDDSLLPLKPNAKVALIGHMAKAIRYQGAGSSHIVPTRLNQIIDVFSSFVYADGCDEKGNASQEGLEEAAKAASSADVAIVFAGLPSHYESEGFDRENLKMSQGHIDMIEAVAKANANTVVVLFSGGVLELPWIDKVKAVLYMGLSGQAGAEAVYELIYGKANPSGKLAETWPLSYEDCITKDFYGHRDAHYMESVYVGYRYYDKAKKDVRFPFGYGLSYTNFSYSDLKIEKEKVTFNLTNVGDKAGSEVVQLYITSTDSAIFRPEKELKRFEKVFLNPGETKAVSFCLDERCFAIWSDGWVVPEQVYKVLIGSSSRDIRLEGEIKVSGVSLSVPSWQKGSWYETLEGAPKVAEWEAMLERKVPEEMPRKGFYTLNETIEEMSETSLIMKYAYKSIEKAIAKDFSGKSDYDNPDFRMRMSGCVDSSLAALIVNGGSRNYQMQGLLDMANGHYLKGLKKLRKKYTVPGESEN